MGTNQNVNTVKSDLALPQFHMANNAIGRGGELQQLHPTLWQSRLPVVITGVGGLGKTTLAQMYWLRHRREYDSAAWLSANVLFSADERHRADNAEYFLRAFLDHPQLKTNLGLTFDPLQHPIEQFRQTIAALATLEGTHLLVLDNMPEVAAQYLPELSALQNWRILLTSRDVLPNTTRFELNTLSPHEAAALFERVYEKSIPGAQPKALNANLAEILNDIDYHTLTIELLAAYAREKKLDPAALLVLLRKQGLTRLDDYDVTSTRSPQSRDISAHLRELFWLELTPEEQEVLRYCAILPTSNVPLDPALVSEDRLCTLFGKQDTEKDFKKLLRRLARLHWLVGKDGGYRCHPVIAETAKAQLRPDAVNCGVLIRNVTGLLTPDKETNEPIIRLAPFAPLAEAVFKGVWKGDSDFVETDDIVAKLAGCLAELFHELGEFGKALDYGNNVIAIREKVLSVEHPDLAQSYNDLAEIYLALGEYPKSLEYHQKALRLREKILPPEDPHLAETYNNLAETYRALSEHQKSFNYHQKVLTIFEKVLPPEHPDLATSYNNLSATYGALGEHQKKLEYDLKALAIREKILPSEHPSLATSYNSLASTYGALGEHKKRLEYNQKALAIQEKVLPLEHPDLATSYNNLAETYRALGEYQKSLEYNLKDIAICEKILPPEHPDLAISYNSLAETYRALGEHQKSLEYNLKDIAICEKVLPPEHPDLATSYNNLALTYSALGEYPKSLEYHQKALTIRENVLPREHPDFAQSYNNVAWTYDALGYPEQAVAFMRRAVVVLEKSLPTEHPYNAIAKESLAKLEEKLLPPK